MKYLSDSEIKTELSAMLKWFSAFCDRHRLYCVPGAGTLIGVKRHQGFIPWDDDIDMLMVRAEYERLLSLSDLIEQESEGKYRLASLFERDYEYPFAKLINVHIGVRQINLRSEYGDYLWLDVFPLDNVPEAPKTEKRFYRRAHVLRVLLESALFERRNVLHYSMHDILKLILHPVFHMFGAKRLGNMLNAYCQKFESQMTEHIGCVVWGYGSCETMERSSFLRYEYAVFEGLSLKIMGNSSDYLHNLYGDYMQLPPKNEQTSHELVAWRV